MRTNRNREGLVGRIPTPDAIRARLAASIREVALLRALLRAAVRKANYPPARCGRKGVA